MTRKVLFVENRQKTRFWYAISKELKQKNIDVCWITQNKLFSVDENNNILPRPKKEDLKYNKHFKDIEISDRYSKTYKNKPYHYEFYYQEILKVLKIEKPNIVFGEATLFHELLTIRACKELGITYLHPTSSRYPAGRFTFYAFDTLEPYYGSFQKWSEDKVKAEIQKITNRSVLPDYMSKRRFLIYTNFLFRRFYSIVESLLSRLFDKYNTPSITEKIRIENSRKENFNKFKKISHKNLDDYPPTKTIVYPLQMEPESNLDVWARRFNNQAKNIEKLIDNLDKDITILVKPNPKSRYEINNELIEMINSNRNVVAVHPNISMEILFKKFKFFFSPSGTIGIESLLASRICFSPCLEVTKVFAKNFYCFPTQLKGESISEQNKISILDYLVYTSFEGIIGDEVHSELAMTKKNLSAVCDAFLKIIELNKTHIIKDS